MTGESLPALIDGWFVVAFSQEVERGKLRAVSYMGQRLVLYRTASGRIAAVDAHCPHLGASFEEMGRVVGETLRCGAHGFRFDRRGACEHAYGAAAPNIRVRSWHVQEWMGAIFVWFDRQGEAPTWALPDEDLSGWSAPRRAFFQVHGHPKEVMENGFDVGHLEGVHGFQDAEPGNLNCEGAHLRGVSGFTAKGNVLGSGRAIRFKFCFDAYGLGLAIAEPDAPSIGVRVRTYLAPTPADDGTMHVRSWTSVYRGELVAARIPVLGRLLPESAARTLMGFIVQQLFVVDFRKDVVYWRKKRYVVPPALSRLDVNIGPFRKWARQFYPDPLAPSHLPMAASAASS